MNIQLLFIVCGFIATLIVLADMRKQLKEMREVIDWIDNKVPKNEDYNL